MLISKVKYKLEVKLQQANKTDICTVKKNINGDIVKKKNDSKFTRCQMMN